MAEDAKQLQAIDENSAMTTDKKKDSGTVKKQRRGIFSRIWNGLFRIRDDDFEKRLQHISKEEASVTARMKKRSHRWRRIARYLIIFSGILEVIAVGYAILTTRSLDLNWKMRALRVLPMFLLPALSTVTYSALIRVTRMSDRKDQKTLERLRAERQANIDELKEKTNYYITQQLIQRYDPDPAAKAAAASVLASKLGADSGLKVYLGDESKPNAPPGKNNDTEIVQSSGLRKRKQSHTRSSSEGSVMMHQPIEEIPYDLGLEGAETPAQNQLVVVEHHPTSTTHDGGWIARIAALLVGEDPTQSYALICGNCHMHNGLARKEDFPYISYYCPHCHALNKSRQSEENPSGSISTNASSPPTPSSGNMSNNANSSVTDSKLISSNSVVAVEG